MRVSPGYKRPGSNDIMGPSRNTRHLSGDSLSSRYELNRAGYAAIRELAAAHGSPLRIDREIRPRWLCAGLLSPRAVKMSRTRQVLCGRAATCVNESVAAKESDRQCSVFRIKCFLY